MTKKNDKMKFTKLYYRVDGRNPSVIMDRKPLTKEEVKKLPLKERYMWFQLGGVEDKDLLAYKRHF